MSTLVRRSLAIAGWILAAAGIFTASWAICEHLAGLDTATSLCVAGIFLGVVFGVAIRPVARRLLIAIGIIRDRPRLQENSYDEYEEYDDASDVDYQWGESDDPDDGYSSDLPYDYVKARAAERRFFAQDRFIGADIGVPRPRQRYLKGQCPNSIHVGEPFSLLVSIVLARLEGNGKLKTFDIPPEGRDVLLVMHAPGLRFLGRQRQRVHVPDNKDSEPVMFELRADMPGPCKMSVTAWLGGSYLGELVAEVTAERDRPHTPLQHDVLAEISTEPADGAVGLVVRYDPVQKLYRFEFRDEDNPDEVTSNLAYEPGPRVEQLVAGLDNLAKGRSGYSATETRRYLLEAGARLWRELVPGQLREQFWDRQDRIRQLTILTDRDAVPWELLYPMDPGRDAGFLVEQFPVTRAVFGRRPVRRLNLSPAWFVLPAASPPEALAEVEVMRRLLAPEEPGAVVSALTPLQDLIDGGRFGLLHFACHNTYDPAAGLSITLDGRQFTPTLMTTATIGQVLAQSAPTVFFNACRSAGLAPTYNRLDGWANMFLEAGAAAFIGSLWAVSDGAAREFAQELYRQLQAGVPLGNAVMHARQLAASHPDDPTWLAYAVYGDPRAAVTQRP
jgi:CHAT domain